MASKNRSTVAEVEQFLRSTNDVVHRNRANRLEQIIRRAREMASCRRLSAKAQPAGSVVVSARSGTPEGLQQLGAIIGEPQTLQDLTLSSPQPSTQPNASSMEAAVAAAALGNMLEQAVTAAISMESVAPADVQMAGQMPGMQVPEIIAESHALAPVSPEVGSGSINSPSPLSLPVSAEKSHGIAGEQAANGGTRSVVQSGTPVSSRISALLPSKVTPSVNEYTFGEHHILGAHVLRERIDGSLVRFDFARYADTTMIEHANGARVWIKDQALVSVETQKGTWSTNDGGTTWMHKAPPDKTQNGLDFRPWRKIEASLTCNLNGDFTITAADEACTTYNTDGTREQRLPDGTRHYYDRRGMLERKQFPNGASETFHYAEIPGNSSPLKSDFVLERKECRDGCSLVERDGNGRPVRVWTESGYCHAVRYDEDGRIDRINDRGGLLLTRHALPGGQYEWISLDSQSHRLSDVEVGGDGTVRFKETSLNGNKLNVEMFADGRYEICGRTAKGDHFVLRGFEGKPREVIPPGEDNYIFEYDGNADLVRANTGKYGRSYDRIDGKWYHSEDAAFNASRPLDVQIKLDWYGDLSVTHQVTQEYFTVHRRSLDGQQSHLHMDMRSAKWTSLERMIGNESSKTVDSDSNDNRAVTVFNHKDGTQSKEVRDDNNAGFNVLIASDGAITIEQLSDGSLPQSKISSFDGINWVLTDMKGKQLGKFVASIEVHREGMTIESVDANGFAVTIKTDAQGTPHRMKDSEGEWVSKDGLNWQKEGVGRDEHCRFVGRPAFPDGTPIMRHNRRAEEMQRISVSSDGKPQRLMGRDGYEFIFAEYKWVLDALAMT